MWQPSCSHDAIRARSELYARIRAFFMQREVLEVETPILSQSGATDPWLASLTLAAAESAYLQTSPEFAMKRLLANGSGPVFQICKCFRANEKSARHNPEFTMLEWYRPGFSLDALMTEISQLVGDVLGLANHSVLSYKQAFIDILGIHPFEVGDASLDALVDQHTGYRGQALERMSKLDLLLSACIEPMLGEQGLCFLTDYPAGQASLAKTFMDEEGYLVAKRAELFYRGIELANAYDELTDVDEQRARFEEDNQQREALGLPKVRVDENLLDALKHGLPECAGVALGVDRLLMLQLGAQDISQVLAFPSDRA